MFLRLRVLLGPGRGSACFARMEAPQRSQMDRSQWEDWLRAPAIIFIPTGMKPPARLPGWAARLAHQDTHRRLRQTQRLNSKHYRGVYRFLRAR